MLYEELDKYRLFCYSWDLVISCSVDALALQNQLLSFQSLEVSVAVLLLSRHQLHITTASQRRHTHTHDSFLSLNSSYLISLHPK